MTDNSIFADILKELKKAKQKHPQWPVHVVARAGIVCEEAGELIRETINWKYEFPVSQDAQQEILDNMRKEALHVAATAIRFIESLKDIKIENAVSTVSEK